MTPLIRMALRPVTTRPAIAPPAQTPRTGPRRPRRRPTTTAAPTTVPPPRYRPQDAGVLLAPAAGETAVDVACRILLLADRYGMQLPGEPGRLRSFATGRRPVDTPGQGRELHRHMPEVLAYLDEHAAPAGHRFAFERGRLNLRRSGPYLTAADAGTVFASPGGRFGGDWVALQVIVLARWYGMTVADNWLHMAWQIEFDADNVWDGMTRRGRKSFNALDDTTDAALAWLNRHARPPGHFFDIDEHDNLVLRRRLALVPTPATPTTKAPR